MTKGDVRCSELAVHAMEHCKMMPWDTKKLQKAAESIVRMCANHIIAIRTEELKS